MSHADKVREAKDVLVEAACIWHRKEAGAWEPEQKSLAAAIDDYEALRAATCPECNGSGIRKASEREFFGYDQAGWPRHGSAACIAGCDNGRRK